MQLVVLVVLAALACVATKQINIVLVGFHDSHGNSTMVRSLGKDAYLQLRGLIAPNKTRVCARDMSNALESINHALKFNSHVFTLFVLHFQGMQEYSYVECDGNKSNVCKVNAWISPKRIAWIDLSASRSLKGSLVLPENHLDIDLDLISQTFVDNVINLPQNNISKNSDTKQTHIQVYNVIGPEQANSHKPIPKAMLERELKRIIPPNQNLVVSVQSITLARDALLSSAFALAQRTQHGQEQLQRYLDFQAFYYYMANDVDTVDDGGVREISVFWFSGVDIAQNPLFVRPINASGLDRIATMGNMVVLIESEHDHVTRSHLYCNDTPLTMSFVEPHDEALLTIAHVLVGTNTRDNWQWAVGAGNAWGRSITNTAATQHVLPLPFVDAVHRRVLRSQLASLKRSAQQVDLEELINTNQWQRAHEIMLELLPNNDNKPDAQQTTCPRTQTLNFWWRQQINRLHF